MVVPDRPGELLLVLAPVLQRPHRRALTHQRAQPGRGGVGVEGLHAEQHEVAPADVTRVIGGRRLHLEVALHAAPPQPAPHRQRYACSATLSDPAAATGTLPLVAELS